MTIRQLLCSGVLLALSGGCATTTVEVAPMPIAVSNNAVAALERHGATYLYSMMGIGPERTWDTITRRAFELNLSTGLWHEIKPVHGEKGRIAGIAAGVGGKVYLFGGYTVAEDQSEVSAPNVDIYDPGAESWSRGSDMPVPVDNSVAGVYRNRWIYLVSGWSMTDNVSDVQIYDTLTDSWRVATPTPGTPVFGHSGGLVGETFVYCDGAFKRPEGTSPRYGPTNECWRGEINQDDMRIIEWKRIEPHPGASRYRAAAGGSPSTNRIYFTGGTDRPYNFDGIGYDGAPSEPIAVTFAWDVAAARWVTVDDDVKMPTMDHRGLLLLDERRIRVGGMEAGQVVTNRVIIDH